MASIKELIQTAKITAKTRAQIEKAVWASLEDTVRKELGHAQLRRLIAAELSDPDQMEFTIDGEPYPIEDVPTELLLRRGYRLVVAGEKLIKRGEAYVAEAKTRRAANAGTA